MHISLSEMLVILLVALLVIKPAHLPDAIKTLAKTLQFLRSTSQKIKHEINNTLRGEKEA